jgi:hypothetical protein
MKDQEFETINDQPEDQGWAEFLSGAARLEPSDEQATDRVLSALRTERMGNADDQRWSQYLSSAAQLQPVDYGAVKPALQALQTVRSKRRVLRLNLARAVAGLAAATVAAVALTTLSPAVNADSDEAYTAYTEASRGW